MSEVLKGISASNGVAFGKALLLEKEEIKISTNTINQEETLQELDKFKNALQKTISDVEALMKKTRENLGAEKAEIFQAHVEILNDPAISESMSLKILSELKNANFALDETVKEICEMFESIDDEYLRERAADYKDVCGRLAMNIAGLEMLDLSCLREEVIIIAKDLLPSDTATMDLTKVLGFATYVGGRTSHTAIMARSLEMPAVVGVGEQLAQAKNGDFLIIDGNEGNVIICPDEATKEIYRLKKDALLKEKALLAEIKELPAKTIDNKHVELAANIGSEKDVAAALNNGAEGIGLFRTEFLYMHNDHFPTEEEQFEIYKKVAQAMAEKWVTIRTLDIGGDKALPYYDFPEELNPFLGWRAIRMCLDEKGIFKTQLRAILRASSFGKIRIMFPMIISVEEFNDAKGILEICKKELDTQNIAYDKNIEVGIMVETPAAVIMADDLAQVADFFSIGTNDLTQYVLAVDRGNEKIAHLYNSFHPAVIRCIKTVIDASHKFGKWTGMCGEFAGDEKAALLLLGMGLDEFSMSAPSIPRVKSLIRKSEYKRWQDVSLQALKQNKLQDVIAVIDKEIE